MRIAAQTVELAWAAPFVIASRVGRMYAGGIAPSARDQREMVRMVSEKMAAMQEASLAMALASGQGWIAMIGSGLAPYHRRAVANAKRLRRR